jgi:hypothetical protein
LGEKLVKIGPTQSLNFYWTERQGSRTASILWVNIWGCHKLTWQNFHSKLLHTLLCLLSWVLSVGSRVTRLGEF